LCIAVSASANLDLETLVEDIDTPWAVSVIKEDLLIVSLRKGGLLAIDLSQDQVRSTKIDYVPDDLYFAGQGGILDIVPHPLFSSNQLIYVSYSAGSKADNYLKIQRLTLDLDSAAPSVTKIEDVFRVSDSKDTPVHYGGRMAFDNEGQLFVTSGDGFDYREDAQRLTSQLGKVLRMTDDGKPLASNPFYDAEETPQSFVFSYGHRNSQGLVVLDDNTVVSHEHGPAGGDEVNIIKAGVNYGWPVATKGKDYIGSTISPFESYPGMEPPLVNWTPSIAPSSMIFYRSGLFDDLQNHYLITSLKYKRIYVLDGNFTVMPDLFTEQGRRLRDIAQSDDGQVYILSDGADAVLYKIVNQK